MSILTWRVKKSDRTVTHTDGMLIAEVTAHKSLASARGRHNLIRLKKQYLLDQRELENTPQSDDDLDEEGEVDTVYAADHSRKV